MYATYYYSKIVHSLLSTSGNEFIYDPLVGISTDRFILISPVLGLCLKDFNNLLGFFHNMI